MNPWQMAQQLKRELELVKWPTGAAEEVFNDKDLVLVTASPPAEAQIPGAFPWCLVIIDGGTADDDDPDLIEQTFRLLSAAEVAGGPQGEFAVIGGPSSDLGSSANRGVAEVGERVRSAVEKLTGADGATIKVEEVATGATTPLGRGLHVVLDENTVVATCTSRLHYEAPQEITHAAGDWTWLGAHCSDRFDFLQYKLVRKAGTLPSTDPTDGDIIYTGTAPIFTATADVGFTYTAFAEYDARERGSADGNSEPEVGSYKVVT